jgi:predicted nucleic acid-binding protein
MRRVFVDAWFLIALTDRTDRHHRAALRLERIVSTASLFTTDGVLMEVLAFHAADSELRQVAAKVARRALRDYAVIPADRALFIRALHRYERRPDKEYSLVDCMSMVVMNDYAIEHVLTNDHHFQQEGFTLLTP